MRTKTEAGVIDCPGILGDLHRDFAKIGSGGVHGARTLMLVDLTTLL
jgi:hypothetical protein